MGLQTIPENIMGIYSLHFHLGYVSEVFSYTSSSKCTFTQSTTIMNFFVKKNMSCPFVD
jgi:hypothetical protein